MGRSKPGKGDKSQNGEGVGPRALLDFASVVTAEGAKSTSQAFMKALKASRKPFCTRYMRSAPLVIPSMPPLLSAPVRERGIMHELNLNFTRENRLNDPHAGLSASRITLCD